MSTPITLSATTAVGQLYELCNVLSEAERANVDSRFAHFFWRSEKLPTIESELQTLVKMRSLTCTCSNLRSQNIWESHISYIVSKNLKNTICSVG